MQYYKDNGETYWAEIHQNSSFTPWDIPSEISIEADYQILSPFFQSSKLLVDLGCGTGMETLTLSKYFDRIIGVDISSQAIDLAKQKAPHSHINFVPWDGLHTSQVDSFIQKYGHANIYMRGVLQQFRETDRKQFRQTLAMLMGKDSFLYFKEINPKAKAFFQQIIFEKRKIPPQIHRVLIHQITQLVGVKLADISSLFPQPIFNVLEKGESFIELYFDEETILKAPATYGIIAT